MKKYLPLIALPLLALPAASRADSTVKINIPANRPSVVSTLASVNEATCAASRKPTVSTRPAHGKVEIREQEKTFDNTASRCHGRKYAGNLFIYFPAPGYQGPDSFVLRADMNKGHFLVPEYFTYEILVK